MTETWKKVAYDDEVDYGLSFEGTVTTYTDTTHFASTSLIGHGDGYFIGYYVYVVYDVGGAGAAPQGEWQLISGYTSATGTFTHTAFSAILAVGDKVLIQHPTLNTIAIDRVYVDNVYGIAGTVWPVGTPGVPVSNLADAITIAGKRKTRTIYIANPAGSYDVPSNMEGYRIIGSQRERTVCQFNLEGKTFTNTVIENCSLAGEATTGNKFVAINCEIAVDFIGDAILYDCRLFDIAMTAGYLYAYNCYADITTAFILYTDATSDFDLVNFSGAIELTNHVAGVFGYVYGNAAEVYIDASCTGGSLYIYGTTKVNNAGTSTLYDYSNHKAGQIATLTKNITSAANAGDVTVATITGGTCLIKSVVLRSNGATTADLTSAGIFGGASKVITFISAADAVTANINAADEQVSWTGAVTLKTDKTIVISLVGTGATAVNLDVDIEYEAITEAAYLA